jgi:alpha-galactosidase
LKLELHYRVHTAYHLIERWTVLVNRGDTPIHIERAFSALWNLPEGTGYFLTHLNGQWIDEFQITREELRTGLKGLDSRAASPPTRALAHLPPGIRQNHQPFHRW